MHGNEMLHHHTWDLGSALGYPCTLLMIQADTVIATWAVLIVIIIASLSINNALKKPSSFLATLTLQYVQTFKDMVEQSLLSAPIKHVTMICAIFTYIFLCNIIQFFPGLEEPTKDLNTTLALGLISFFYVHSTSIRHKGFKHYIQHYFEPFFIMFPMHLVGVISSVLSLSFRLFGNIFGGTIISSLYASAISSSLFTQCFGILSGFNIIIFLIFGLAEGLMQAFVFTMLTLTYLSLEIAPTDDDHESLSKKDIS